MPQITNQQLDSYRHHLATQEKAAATQKCYLRDIAALPTSSGTVASTPRASITAEVD